MAGAKAMFSAAIDRLKQGEVAKEIPKRIGLRIGRGNQGRWLSA